MEVSMKRITSFLLAILMLVSLIPADIAYAMEDEKLDVVLLNDGQYLIRLPGVDYTKARLNEDLPDINPEDNPKEFNQRTIKVDIAELVVEATNVQSVTVTVTCDEANYSREYVMQKNDFGEDKGIKVPVPKDKYTPIILVKFDDGRDTRYLVEAKNNVTNVVKINIDFLGHTGVATRWFGNSDKPDVEANYLGLNKSAHKFNLPKVDQNMVLRSPSNTFEWRGHDNLVLNPIVPEADIRANGIETARKFHLEIQDALQGQLADSKYYYQITGESYTHKGFTATMREKNTVDFDAGDGTWKTAKPAQQFAANGLKLSEKFMDAPDTIGPVTIPSKDTLTPPEAEAGKPAKKFAGWSTTKNGPAVDMSTYKVTGDVTFYALYEEEEQGKVKVEYKDSKTNAAIDSKYQLKGQEYPAEKTGDMDKAIKDEVFDKEKAPKFLGYKIKSITTDPVPNPPASANYTKNGDYTVIYTYDKLDDIIPEKKNGQDNPDVTPEVKEHYAKVTYQVAAADAEKAKLQLDNADATSPLVYYVNPLEGKKISEVANVKAVSKDTNLYKVNANDMWTFNPDSISGTNQVISQATDSDGNVVKTEITLTAKVADTDAKKYGDKLKAQDIVKWVGDTVEWKDGVKTIDGVTFKSVEDKSGRNTNAAGKFTGKLEVTFQDDSKATVDNQNLFVRAKKADKVTPSNDDPGKYPTDKVEVKFVASDGIKSLTPENKVMVLQKEEKLAENDYPTVTVKDNYKTKTKNIDYYDVQPNTTLTAPLTTVTATAVEKGTGSAKVEYHTGANDITAKIANLKVDGQTYPADNKLTGTEDSAIDTTKITQPELIGYKKVNITTEPATDAKYTEAGTAKVIFNYEKIDDIIGPVKPGDKKPTGYVIVAFKAATGAELDPGETSYFVNPKAEIKANISKVGDNYQISGKKADGTDLTGNVPAVTSTNEKKYEIQYADGEAKKWGYDNFGKVGQDITTDTTFTAQVIELGKPSVKFPPVEIKKGGSEVVTPEVKDKYNKKIEKPGKPEVNEKPNGVTVTPNDDGTVKIEVPKDYTGSGTFTIKVTYKIDGKDVPGEIKVTIKEDKKPEPKPEPKPVPEVEIPGIKYKDHKVPTYPVYAVVEKKDAEKVTPEIFTHERYIFGYPDDTIRPDGDMTRAEAIAVVARLQKLDLSDKTSNIYKDTKAGMWYNAAINAAFREGYLLEKEGENIRPNEKITRAELALLISHIDKKNDKVAPFEDVKGHKFEAAINQAYGNERIKGYPDGTFKPDNSITRAEVATMLNKLYDRYPDKNFIDANQNLVHNYKDMSYKGHWGYYELVEAYHTHKFARLANNMEEWKAIIK